MVLSHGQWRRCVSSVLIHDSTGMPHELSLFFQHGDVDAHTHCLFPFPQSPTPLPADHVISNAITIMAAGSSLEHSIGSPLYAAQLAALTVMSGAAVAASAWLQARWGFGSQPYYMEGLLGASSVAYGTMVGVGGWVDGVLSMPCVDVLSMSWSC